MGLLSWIFYMIVAIIFFLIILVLDHKYKLTKLEKIVVSIFLLLFVAGMMKRFLFSHTEQIFFIYVFMFFIDLIYHSYFLERDFFDKQEQNVYYYSVLVIIGFMLNQELINRVDQVFLSGEDFRIIIWFLLFLFFYFFFKNRNILQDTVSKTDHLISREVVLVQYVKLKDQYYDDLHCDEKEISNLLLAIMILENHRRGKILRKFDYFSFRLNGGKKKLGIMQVESKQFITDQESIEIVYKKLDKLFHKDIKSKKKMKVEEVIEKYSKEDASKIQAIFDIIRKF
ncbi:MAG: hypothetical protein IJJ63_01610 [Bacilli bacterium]|nr:hypothetical protein [Bacilli bacterium]